MNVANDLQMVGAVETAEIVGVRPTGNDNQHPQRIINLPAPLTFLSDGGLALPQ